MANHVYVSKANIKSCNKCNEPIAFIKNKQGKWYPVDVLLNENGQSYYESGKGAYGNLTPWHTCNREVKHTHVDPNIDVMMEVNRLANEGKGEEALLLLRSIQ